MALAAAGGPAAVDVALAAEVETWRRYKEAVALLKSADPGEKARGSRMMCEPSVYELHQAEVSGRPYRPTVKAAPADLGEARMIALAKSGDMGALELHFAAHPGSHDRYRELSFQGRLEPTPAERIALRQATDAELKKKIKALHASKDRKDKDALAKLLKDDERAAGLWGEMCLTGEIVPTMPS